MKMKVDQNHRFHLVLLWIVIIVIILLVQNCFPTFAFQPTPSNIRVSRLFQQSSNDNEHNKIPVQDWSIPKQRHTNPVNDDVDDAFIHEQFEQHGKDDFIRNAFENEDTPTDPSPSRIDCQTTKHTAFNTLTSTSGDNNNLSLSSSLSSSRVCVFPMSLVINHDLIKQALMITAVNPSCGLIISGARGTCKTVLARSLQRIVPTYITRVQHSPYNIDPTILDSCDSSSMDTFLRQQLEQSGETSSILDLPTEIIETPFVNVPVSVMEDSLIGSVDLEQSLETGTTMFSPGLLAKAHRGILYVDELNLLEDEITSLLFQVMADRKVKVEREGISSVEYPCDCRFIATYNPEQGEIRDHILDRFAMQVSADYPNLNLTERVQAVENVELFTELRNIDNTNKNNNNKAAASAGYEKLERALEEERAIQDVILAARERLPHVSITHDQILYLCDLATRGECEGQRAEYYATLVAKAAAAIAGRTHVNANDLQLAILLCMAPRMNNIASLGVEQNDNQETSTTPPPPPPPPSTETPPPPPPEMMEQEQTPPPPPDNEDLLDLIPEEFLFGVGAATIDPRILQFAKLRKIRKGASGGKRSRKFNIQSGRFVKAIFPRANAHGRLAVGATLRAAAPHQKLRRERLHQGKSSTSTTNNKKRGKPSVLIAKDDFRIQQLKKKTGSLIIFVVDASGSMALNRMAAAKGAAMSLLREAYKCRDKISLISFRGQTAEILVPPTKSTELTSRRLESMPCGSKTPLAHGLILALRTGLNAIKVKQDTGKVILVVISDCRPNVPLAQSEGETELPPDVFNRTFLKNEVLEICKLIGSMPDFNLLCIDTEDKFVRTGIAQEMTRVAQGSYQALARHTDSETIAQEVRSVIR